jgi:hypothetical protein
MKIEYRSHVTSMFFHTLQTCYLNIYLNYLVFRRFIPSLHLRTQSGWWCSCHTACICAFVVLLKVKQAVESHRVVRHRDSHIFWTIGSQMLVMLSALRAGRPLLPGRFLVLISVRGWVDARTIGRLEGSVQLKNTVISSGMDPATLRPVA